LKNLDEKEIEVGTMGRARQLVGLKQGIDQDTAKKIVKDVKDAGFKKVQVQIQKDELRVISPSKDTLQEAMAFLRSRDVGVRLDCGNDRWPGPRGRGGPGLRDPRLRRDAAGAPLLQRPAQQDPFRRSEGARR